MGNTSNAGNNEEDDIEDSSLSKSRRKRITEEERNDPCYKPVIGGKRILDLPYDTLGEILEYSEDFKDVRSFMSSCKEIYDYFQNRGGIEKVTFSLNPTQRLTRPFTFVHRLKCSVGIHELSWESLLRFPSIRYLNLRNCNNFNDELFKHFKHLTEFHWLGVSIELDYTLYDLPESLKALSIRRHRGDPIQLGVLGKFLRKRKELEHIELWRFSVNYQYPNFDADETEFFQDLNSYKKLRVLRLRYCSFVIPKFDIFTTEFSNTLEELDLCGYRCFMEDFTNESKEPSSVIKFPNSLRILKLDELETPLFRYVVENMSLCERVEVMDISREEKYGSRRAEYWSFSSKIQDGYDPTLLLGSLVPKVPRLRVLDMNNIEITDEDIKILLEAKELDIVTISMRSQCYSTKEGRLKSIKFNQHGVQQVGKVKFLVY